MRRFSLWLRGKPMIADSALALLFFILEVVSFVGSDRDERWPQLVLGLLICLPVVWRRKYPRVSAAAILLMSLTSTVIMWTTDNAAAEHPGLLALGVALYTLVAYVDRRTAAVYLGLLVVDTVLSSLVVRQDVILGIIISALLFALAWITAEFFSARRAYDEEVAARLKVAEYDRDRRAEEAVATERTRIARELHDVVAHAVSVMIVQADGASFAVDTNPALAKKALGNISSTGRDALAELRRTVSLLRSEVSDDAMPQHGTAGIAKVVEMMRATGLHVRLELTGELDDISPSVSLGIHRLVQESLTNVLRHAGENPKARVTVRRTETAVLVEVIDNGSARSAFIGGSGNGLVGMRERVHVLHGTLETGRRPDGSWRVYAELPLEIKD
ncbi:sensor histidine kinase [Rhodococcus sp. IEGM 1379]|uniref:sensor histidine kinase n=1 Tax=Rhodococcus sp. IEGM 1379 TaxID=3047086 RepID=UPI0024B6FE5B|nr:sensor histidine kinase [Rhodococcus sp. IEGM 1379]MDI9913713.1 sensor histidine kinase [Rhodococcus sp. IEGM 1379]